MDSKLIYVAVLLMILTILVLLLVLLEGQKKGKKTKDHKARVSPPVKAATTPVQAAPQPVRQMAHQPVENPGIGYIYAYPLRDHVRRCPGCDAENPLGSGRCVVCGCEMGPTGR